jgi:flagellar motor switch protein FliN/FliY
MANETETQQSEAVAGAETGTKTEGQPSESQRGLGSESKIKPAAFDSFKQRVVNPASSAGNMNLLLDVPMKIEVRLGSAKMIIKDLLQLGQGSVIELDKIAGDPMDILISEKLIARGEIVVVNDMFGVRITDIVSPVERIETLK